MAFRNIMVPVSGTDADGTALATAARVAALFGSHIDGLHVQRDMRSSFPTGDESYNYSRMQAVAAQLRESIESQEKAAHSAFQTCIDAHQIALSDEPSAGSSPSASWKSVTGVEADEIAERGRAYDLIVVGRPASAKHEAAREVAEAALFGTGRPVLVAPADAPDTLGGTALVAWNKTVQSARAVAEAMPLLERAGHVTVFMVTTGAKRGPSPDDIARTLAWNGIEAEVKEVAPEGRRVGRILLDEATRAKADLLVMGGYSHSRMREMILGGVTRHILDHTELPVLMAH